jgi:hypothetical protein
MSWVSGRHLWYLSQRSEELRLNNMAREFDNFEPPLENSFFRYISWLNA